MIVVDSGSEDATRELARAAGAVVVEHPWRGFGTQRNVAIDHATKDWILEVDADERVTPELRRQVEAFIASPTPGVDLAGLPISQLFLGAGLRGSAKYPDYRHRLFRRGSYRHDEGRTVHEGLWPAGPVHPFHGDLEHLLASTPREAVVDMLAYSRAEAAQLAPPEGARAYAEGIALRPVVKFAYRLVVWGAWRDGWRGLAKIGLDSLSDALVWARVLVRRPRSNPGQGARSGHFSAATGEKRAGAPRLVTVARGSAAARRAADWAGRAAQGGSDVTLITDSPPPAVPGVRFVSLKRLSPGRLVRTVEAEHQLRPIDAAVPAGTVESALLSLVPKAVRGLDGVSLRVDPHELGERVRSELR